MLKVKDSRHDEPTDAGFPQGYIYVVRTDKPLVVEHRKSEIAWI